MFANLRNICWVRVVSVVLFLLIVLLLSPLEEHLQFLDVVQVLNSTKLSSPPPNPPNVSQFDVRLSTYIRDNLLIPPYPGPYNLSVSLDLENKAEIQDKIVLRLLKNKVNPVK